MTATAHHTVSWPRRLQLEFPLSWTSQNCIFLHQNWLMEYSSVCPHLISETWHCPTCLVCVDIPRNIICNVLCDAQWNLEQLCASDRLHNTFNIVGINIQILGSSPWRAKEHDIGLQRRSQTQEVSHHKFYAVSDSIHIGIVTGKSYFLWVDVYCYYWNEMNMSFGTIYIY